MPARGAQAEERGESRPSPHRGCTNWSYEGRRRRKKDFRSILGVMTLQRYPASSPRSGACFFPRDAVWGLDLRRILPDFHKLEGEERPVPVSETGKTARVRLEKVQEDGSAVLSVDGERRVVKAGGGSD
jgi:hypothetical protein